jgi:hypothetical protein
MIRVSPDEAKLLLNGWKERGLWIGVKFALREDMLEEHTFWARVVTVSPEDLTLAGEFAVVKVPLEADDSFEYLEVSEAPPDLRERFSQFSFCFMIRSNRVLAILFGERPSNGEE